MSEALMNEIKLLRAEQRQGQMVLFTMVSKIGNPEDTNEDIEEFVVSMLDLVEDNAHDAIFGVGHERG